MEEDSRPVKLTLTKSNIQKIKVEQVKDRIFVGVDLIGITTEQLLLEHKDLYHTLADCMVSTQGWFKELQV